MKRSVLLPLLLLLLILLFSTRIGIVMTADTDRWQSQLQSASRSAREQDWTAVSATLSAAYEAWSARQVFLHIVARHDAVDDAEAMYRRAMAFAETAEPSEFLAETSDLCDQLRLLAEMERLKLGNIL